MVTYLSLLLFFYLLPAGATFAWHCLSKDIQGVTRFDVILLSLPITLYSTLDYLENRQFFNSFLAAFAIGVIVSTFILLYHFFPASVKTHTTISIITLTVILFWLYFPDSGSRLI